MVPPQKNIFLLLYCIIFDNKFLLILRNSKLLSINFLCVTLSHMSIAAGRHTICEFSHLAVEIRAGVIKKADGLLPAQLIGHEHGEKLRPVDVLRNTCERQRARGIVECVDDVRSCVHAVGQCVAVEVDECVRAHAGTSFSKKITLHYTLFPPVSQPAKFKEF